MYLNDIFKENIQIHILNIDKNNLYLFYSLHNLFKYLMDIYNVSIFLYSTHNKIYIQINNINYFDSYDNLFFKFIIPNNLKTNICLIENNNDNNIDNIFYKSVKEFDQINFFKNYKYNTIKIEDDLSYSKINSFISDNLNNSISIDYEDIIQNLLLKNKEFKNNNNLIKVIDLKNIKNIKLIYENIFSIPFSINHKQLNLNRFIKKENELYNFHIDKFNNFSYIFCSSYYHLKDSEYAIYIYLFNFYKKINDFENPFFISWYNNNDPYFLYGKIIENAEEIYIHINDIEWIEYIISLDLTKIKKKNLYYNNENLSKINQLKKKYIKLFDWNLILLNNSI